MRMFGRALTHAPPFSSQIDVIANPNIFIRTKSKTHFSFAFFNHSHISKSLLFLRRTLLFMSISSPEKPKRPLCPTCSKPTKTCFCSHILTSGINNSVCVTILQHSLESKHPLNSTRIARLGLRNLNVVSVSDVNFKAGFLIRLLKRNSELGLVRNCSDNLDCNLKNDIENMECSNHVVDSELSVEINDENFRGSVIKFVIGKYGVIDSVSHIWRSLTQTQKPDLVNIMSCPEASEALSKGFMVKKLMRRKGLKGNINLKDGDDDGEECEFELEVPPGSVLLFPSEKAVDITEVGVIDFEIRNLIVLDGTWAKARRVFSENPWLNFLPHVKLKMDKMSLYSEVRREPKDGYLSTIESIVYCLTVLGENHEGLDNLLDAFESMVGYQRRFKDERLNKTSQV